jgi:AcrR family transcriptional regulator
MYTAGVDSRQRIIESTQELLWERGYTGTSPKAIQARASVGQGSMYHHFASKQVLAAIALESSASTACAEAEAVLNAEGPALERICRYLLKPREVLRGCRIGQMAQDPEIACTTQLRSPVTVAFATQQELIEQTLAEARASGELRADVDPAAIAATLMAVLQGAYTLARAQGSEHAFHRAIWGFLLMLETHTSNGLPERALIDDGPPSLPAARAAQD